MIDPGFKNQWPDAVDHNYCVLVLCSDGFDEGIAAMPRGEVIPSHREEIQHFGHMHLKAD